MLSQELPEEFDSSLAEKCRKALEASFGKDIPVPKCIPGGQGQIQNSSGTNSQKVTEPKSTDEQERAEAEKCFEEHAVWSGVKLEKKKFSKEFLKGFKKF